MSLDLLDPPMASAKPKAMSVKLPMDVIESARIVSAFRGESMTDLLAELLRPALAKMEADEIAKRSQSMAGKRKGGGK